MGLLFLGFFGVYIGLKKRGFKVSRFFWGLQKLERER